MALHLSSLEFGKIAKRPRRGRAERQKGDSLKKGCLPQGSQRARRFNTEISMVSSAFSAPSAVKAVALPLEVSGLLPVDVIE